MTRIIVLHTNDIHGRVEGLARIATLVAQIRAENEGTPVFYFDLGDSEDYVNRLSSLTKGAAMHRLLDVAGCQATVVGNAILSRFGPEVLTEETTASSYPHLVANARYSDGRPIGGTQPSAIVRAGALSLGLVGMTAPTPNYERFFGVQILPTVSTIKEEAARLRHAGADAVILLSHLGGDADREIALDLQDEVPLILGSHSHELLPQGEWVGDLLIAQAGEYAQHLGRVDLHWDGVRLRARQASVIPVTEAIPPSAAVQETARRIEDEVQEFLSQIICELPHGLDYAVDAECGMGNLMADALRRRMGADVAVSVVGPTFTEGLPAGPLRRETLWSICPSTGNPGVAQMTGAQLSALLQRGLDPDFAADRPMPLRGRSRGLMHVSGATVRDNQVLFDGQPLDPAQRYRVAGSDFELEPGWGYAGEAWQLSPRYEVDVIMREVLDDYLRGDPVLPVQMGRLGGAPDDTA